MVSCKDCRLYKKKEPGYTMGMCTFPLPVYIQYSSVGYGFINEESEHDCATFKPYESDLKNSAPNSSLSEDD